MSNKLIGTDPNQVPSNADLGTLAYQDADNVNLGTLLVTDRIGIDTSGTDTLNSPYLFTVADESHGVAIDYVSAYPTKPGGLFSTAGGSTWPFNQYGNMILTTRTDYGGYYDIALVTASTNNTPEARLVVKHSGNVGIGTDSPGEKLEVLGNIKLRQSASNSETVYISTNPRGGATADADLRLGNSVNGDILTIHNTNVGIGTTVPGKLLTLSRATEAQSEQLEFRNVGGISNGNFDGIKWTQGSTGGTMLAEQRVNYYTTGVVDMSFNLRNEDNVLYLKAGGNVGIGGVPTSSYGLEIQKSNAGAGLYLHRTDTGAMPGASIYHAYQITQSNGQSARLAEITATGVSGWGGELAFGVKPANGTPNNSATARMWIKASGDIIQGNSGTHSWTSNNTTLFQAGGIGITSNSDWSLQLAGSTTERIRFFSSAGGSATVGNISVDASGTTYSTTSDRRLKKDIEPITDGTDKLMAMNPVTHTWISNPDEPKVHGFIAQEMQEVVPEAVSGDAESDEMMSMDYGRITPVLVAALQEANKKISELEARLNDAGL